MAACVVQGASGLAIGQPTDATGAGCLGFLLTQSEYTAAVGPPDFAALGVSSSDLGAAFGWAFGAILGLFVLGYAVGIGVRFIRMMGR